jgi:hypothetical protein
MLFHVEVHRKTGGWGVSYGTAQGPLLDSDGKPITRTLPACAEFPLPPVAECEVLTATDEHYTLCTRNDPGAIRCLLGDFADKIPTRTRSDGLIALGRYLFAALIGDEAWLRIRTTAGANSIELGLSWNSGEPLSALPWEVMRDGVMFLVQHPGVSIIRRVRGTGPPAKLAISSPMKVLIVVGTDAADPTVQGGIEYARLVQSLRTSELDLSLKSFLLLDATQSRIETTLREFRPDIVHIICHGDIDEYDNPYLEIRNEENRNAAQAVYAGPLQTMLSVAPPQVVIITACNSAKVTNESLGQLSTPMAEELVRTGFSLVFGMAGRIVDQTCRLFTRRFYEALLQGSDVAQATADGRRAAFAGAGFDPTTSIDWVLPTLFMSDRLSDTRFPVTLQHKDQEWSKHAVDFDTKFPPFCDRSHHLAKLDLLTASDAVQLKWLRNPIQGLVLTHGRPDRGQYGSSRIMREFAAKATREGHIVVVFQPKKDDHGRPKRAEEMLRVVREGLRVALGRFFNLACPSCTIILEKAGIACEQCEAVRAALDVATLAAATAEEQGSTLRNALLAMLSWGRKFRDIGQPEAMKLILMIEDLHEFGPDVLDTLLEEYIAKSFRIASNDLRLVLSYMQGNKRIADWLETAAWLDNDEKLTVGRLTGAEEEIAYDHYLRNGHSPVTIHPQEREHVIKTLREEVIRGIASNFKDEANTVNGVIAYLKNSKRAIDVDDDGVLHGLAVPLREVT